MIYCKNYKDGVYILLFRLEQKKCRVLGNYQITFPLNAIVFDIIVLLLIISCCRRFQLDNIWYFAYRFFNYHITLRCENDWSDLPFTPCRVRYTCLDLSPLVGGRWQYPFMVIWIVRSGKGLCWGVYFSQQNNSLEVRNFIVFKIFS